MNLLTRIAFALIFVPILALAKENIVTVRAWSPQFTPYSFYPYYVLPGLTQSTNDATIPSYLSRTYENVSLREFVPFIKWAELATVFSTFDLGLTSKKKRVLLVANKLIDHQPNSSRLRTILPKLIAKGIEPYVLPVGALTGLSQSEQTSFFIQAGGLFSKLVFLGGNDLDPFNYDEEVNGAVGFNRALDQEELNIFRGFYLNSKIEIFAICRGSQLIAVALGCKLHQHIYDVPGTKFHFLDYAEHPVLVLPTNNNNLKRLINREQEPGVLAMMMSHYHHQSVILGHDHPTLQVSAVSTDGLIVKAFESRDGRITALQGHPEVQTKGDGVILMNKLCEEILASQE